MEHIYSTEDESSMIVEVVVYNHEATSLALTKETYKDVINQTQASAKTCFASTFDCIRGMPVAFAFAFEFVISVY